MKIKSKMLNAAAVSLLGLLSNNASAALTTGTVLNFDAGQYQCLNGGTYPSCTDSQFSVSGSWWAFDLFGDGVFDPVDKIAMAPGSDGGLVIGVNQVAGGIDDTWQFLASPGNHVSVSPVTVVNDMGATKQLDFSGWALSWNGNFIPIGDLMETELADITCSSIDCADGDSFVLDFFSTVPAGEPVGFGGVSYALHLEGVISAVPVPASIWLLTSGLGLLGVASRNRKKQDV